MTFTCEQIKQLDNPYEKLNTADVLAEHHSELDKLSPKEMHDLAVKILMACPAEEMENFAHEVDSFQSSKSTFSVVLARAYETKKCILALSNPEQTNPHELLMDEETNEGILNEFDDLALNLLSGNEVTIATRLAIATPMKSRSALSFNVSRVFTESEFAEKVGAALTLRREIDRFLLGNKPQDFFTSNEFNLDLCHEFSILLMSLLEGREQEIGEKLAPLEHQQRHQISRQLDQLKNKAHDKHCPFKLIIAAMNSPTESQQKITVDESSVSNPYRQFNTSPRARAKQPAETTLTAARSDAKTNIESEDEKKEESCASSFCGLLKW
ncbi:lpg0008 family Dot/Icm T4SS effector [Legionella fallonii]|uniref:Uncharacterized protein n=1 Tax=Legionella fallonii LLAP-10 TaxID=1212491 RepID=A0A098G0K5_9GAMM|nr:lpg0008 family Dot/Icm T4SS effector [Legionella fallonii]CEG55499.1 protein of unknown function [Legionella fallonii LLAP-10]